MMLVASRLRRGELLAGAAAVAMLVFLFVPAWFRPAGAGPSAASVDGWSGLPGTRWLIVAAAAAGLLLAGLQATRAAPALPVTMSVVVSAVALATTVVLVVRVLTTSATVRAGGILGPVAAAALLLGGFWSMRDEAGWSPGPDRPVERISL